MFFRPTIQVELEPEDKWVKEIYIRGEPRPAPRTFPRPESRPAVPFRPESAPPRPVVAPHPADLPSS